MDMHVLTYNWSEGDLLIWDNIALRHARPDLNKAGAPRTLRKTLVPSAMIGNERPNIKVTNSRVGD